MSTIPLPTELISRIFDFFDLATIKDVRLVCRQFKSNANGLLSTKCRYLITILNTYEAQVKEKTKGSECIISDQPPVNPTIVKIMPKVIADYLALVAKSPLKAFTSSYSAFKEQLIDSLCTIACADELTEAGSIEVLAKAQNRVRTDCFSFMLNSTALIGEWSEMPDFWCRKYGNYGTEGGLLPSFQLHINDTNRAQWKSHGPALDDKKTFFIDEWLPGKLFLGKKEGDTITFTCCGKEIKLLLKQMGSPRDGGSPFEIRMWHNQNTLAGDFGPESYTPPLSREEQKERIRVFFRGYLDSLGMKKIQF